jgi:hypothetical protein
VTYYHGIGLVEGDYTKSWEHIPSDLVIVCWPYAKRRESLAHFSGVGFRTFAGAYYEGDNLDNPSGWMETLNETPNAVGILYTTWQNNHDLPAGFGDPVSSAFRRAPLQQLSDALGGVPGFQVDQAGVGLHRSQDRQDRSRSGQINKQVPIRTAHAHFGQRAHGELIGHPPAEGGRRRRHRRHSLRVGRIGERVRHRQALDGGQ